MVRASISNSADFLRFNGLLIENILTCKGRKPFPVAQFKLSHMDPRQHYQVFLIFKQEPFKMIYSEDEWFISRIPADSYNEQSVEHHFGVRTGVEWMMNAISFDFLRITNKLENKSDTVVFLNTRHKYIPTLKIYPVNKNVFGHWEKQVPVEVSFDEAVFVTVTAYINNQMKEAKIEMNKYSKWHAGALKRRNGEPEDDEKKTEKKVCTETKKKKKKNDTSPSTCSTLPTSPPNVPSPFPVPHHNIQLPISPLLDSPKPVVGRVSSNSTLPSFTPPPVAGSQQCHPGNFVHQNQNLLPNFSISVNHQFTHHLTNNQPPIYQSHGYSGHPGPFQQPPFIPQVNQQVLPFPYPDPTAQYYVPVLAYPSPYYPVYPGYPFQ